MFRTCSKCGKTLPESEFNWKVDKIRHQSHCKSCSRAYIRDHYRRHKKYYVEKARKRNDLYKEIACEYLGPYLLSHPCVDCGEKDILVLEFDHRDRKMKVDTIGSIIRSGASLEDVKQEVLKCDIRCANCHRRKTEIENNSWKLKYAPVA